MPTFADGLAGMRVIDAIRASAAAGGAVAGRQRRSGPIDGVDPHRAAVAGVSGLAVEVHPDLAHDVARRVVADRVHAHDAFEADPIEPERECRACGFGRVAAAPNEAARAASRSRPRA